MDVRIMVSATRGEGIDNFPALRAALEFVQPVSVALVMSPALVAPSGSYLAGTKKEPRALADRGTSHMICTADALNARRISAGRGLARQYDEQTDAGRPRGIACQFLHLYQPAKWLTHGQVSTRHADEGRHPRLCSARQASRGCRPSSA